MRYVKFTETNESEGETWAFWLQYDGNEAALAELRSRLAAHVDPPYALADETEDESAVDLFVRNAADDMYLPSDSKITGTLVLPDKFDEHLEELYKGGIQDLFRQEEV